MLPQRLGPHPPLPVHGERLDLRRADPEEPERAVDGDVALLADEDAEPRRSLEAVAGEIPTGGGEHVVAGGGERSHVRQLAAGDEPGGDAVGQAEQLAQPGERDLLHDGRAGPPATRPRVLVPGRRQPVGRERGRQRATDHEPEVASARHRDDTGLRLRRSAPQSPALARDPSRREWAAESLAQLLDRGIGTNRPLVERAETAAA